MTERRGFAPKTDLTPRERLKATYFYVIRGVSQQVLADLFEVNQGRVNEAISEVTKALGPGLLFNEDEGGS